MCPISHHQGTLGLLSQRQPRGVGRPVTVSSKRVAELDRRLWPRPEKAKGLEGTRLAQPPPQPYPLPGSQTTTTAAPRELSRHPPPGPMRELRSVRPKWTTRIWLPKGVVATRETPQDLGALRNVLTPGDPQFSAWD